MRSATQPTQLMEGTSQIVTRSLDPEVVDAIWAAIEEGAWIEPNATLEAAMPIFEETQRRFLPVVTLGEEGEPPQIHGALFHVDALREYNRALAATAAEEHG